MCVSHDEVPKVLICGYNRVFLNAEDGVETNRSSVDTPMGTFAVITTDIQTFHVKSAGNMD